MQHHLSLLALCAGTVLLAGCDDDKSNPPPATRDVTIQFAARAGDTDIRCGAVLKDMGAAGDRDLTVLDFRLYVSNIHLVTDTGEEVPVLLEQNAFQLQHGEHSVALLDFVQRGDSCKGDVKPVHKAITGTVADEGRTFTGIRFEVGVPEGHNHEDINEAGAPLDILSMAWSWQAGRKFTKFETQYLDPAGGMPVSQVIHVGSTGCTGGSAEDPSSVTCEGPFRSDIELDGFDPATDTLVIDYGALLAETDLSMMFMCMPGSDATCRGLLNRMGLNGAGGAIGTQSLFRVE